MEDNREGETGKSCGRAVGNATQDVALAMLFHKDR